jgi:TonB family protein
MMLVVGSSAAAQVQETAPPVSRPTRAPHRVAMAMHLAGTWVVRDQPKDSMVITMLRQDAITIERPGLFAVGLRQREGFVAIARSETDAPLLLRLDTRDKNELRVEFADDVLGPSTRQEYWVRPMHRSAPAPPPKTVVVPPTPDRPPKLGEYVYVEELPEAVHKVLPEYPDAMRTVEGTVMLQALVGADGLVQDTKIVKSVPSLDPLAVAAVRQWRFKPAMTAGKPVAVWVAVPVKFPPR